METLPSLMALPPGNLLETLHFLEQEIPQKELRDIYVANPLLVTVDFAHHFIPKFNLFLKLKFTRRDVFRIFRYFPGVFVRSLHSVQTKVKYLTRRGRIDLRKDKAFPSILEFQYARFIRARGEAMLKSSVPRLPWTQVMQMTDEDFCAHFKISPSDFAALQAEVEQTAEMDLKLKGIVAGSSRADQQE